MHNSKTFIRLYKVNKQFSNVVKPLDKEDVFTAECMSQHTAGLKVFNIHDVERSMRFNPLQQRYIRHFEDCETLARNIFMANPYTDSPALYCNNAIQLIAGAIYFLIHYTCTPHDKCGEISSIPHLIAFLNQENKKVIEILCTNEFIKEKLKPLIDCYKGKALEQLNEVFYAARTQLSYLSIAQVVWIMSKGQDDFIIDEEPQYVAFVCEEEQSEIDNTLIKTILNTDLIANPIQVPCDGYIAQCIEKKHYFFNSTQDVEEALTNNDRHVYTEVETMINNFID